MKSKTPHTKEPFTVPEGYFEQLTARVMKRVEREAARPRAMELPHATRQWQRAGAAAAIVAIMALAGYGIASPGDDPEREATGPHATENAVYTVDEVADYAMLDHQDIYEIISE